MARTYKASEHVRYKERRFQVRKLENGNILVVERCSRDRGPAAGGIMVWDQTRFHYPTKQWPTRGLIFEVLNLSGIKPG